MASTFPALSIGGRRGRRHGDSVAPGSDLIESWPLSESSDGSISVTREGTQPTTPPTNPARINLLDPHKIVGSAGAAFFPEGSNQNLQIEDLNSAGAINSKKFIGGGPWWMQLRAKWDTFPGSVDVVHHGNFSWELALHSDHTLQVFAIEARTDLTDTLTSSLTLATGTWYTIKFGYDGSKLFLDVTPDGGSVTHNELAVPRLAVFNSSPLLIGGNLSSGSNAFVQNVEFHRFADTSGACPFTGLTLLQADFETTANRGTPGLYWYRPFVNPAGGFVWFHSTDHDTVGGLYMGFSADPVTKPTAWTLIFEGTGTIGGSAYVQAETPHYKYVPGDANGRPHYVYFQVGLERAGVANSQQTCLITCATLSTTIGDWVSEGIVIPNGQSYSGISVNHTGYAIVYDSSDLPVITGFHAYHLGSSVWNVSFCSPSSDPKSFDTLGSDPEELDSNSRFPAGYDEVTFDNIFSPDGVKVYAVGRGYFPGGRGVALFELSQENGQWRQPTGKIWQLILDTDVYPTLGYCQDVRICYDAPYLYIYPLRGFYPTRSPFNGIGDERVDLYRMTWGG